MNSPIRSRAVARGEVPNGEIPFGKPMEIQNCVIEFLFVMAKILADPVSHGSHCRIFLTVVSNCAIRLSGAMASAMEYLFSVL